MVKITNPKKKKEHAHAMTQLEEKICKEIAEKGISGTLLGILVNMSINKLKWWL